MKSNDFFKEFKTSPKKKFLFGINPYADAISDKFDIDGFIDEYTNKKTYKGKPIIKLESIPKDSLVISTVTNSRPKTAIKKLQASGIKYFVDYFSFADGSNGVIPQLSCIVDMRLDFSSNKLKYDWVRSLLKDEESIQTYDSIMSFRLNADIGSLEKFSFRVDEQYFEPFLNLSKGEVFVDGGGHDGFTTAEFSRRCAEYGAVHFFEPSETNLKIARENLSAHKSINYYQLGLFDRATTLYFDSESGSACRISDTGTEQIPVDTLDSTVLDKVTFIKLDLEGAEMAALRGMKNHILNDHPKLAVAVYHQPSDFRDVPDYILGLRDDYEVYLRHYTEGWAETIMFFIPKSTDRTAART